jgi:hypothetical protein
VSYPNAVEELKFAQDASLRARLLRDANCPELGCLIFGRMIAVTCLAQSDSQSEGISCRWLAMLTTDQSVAALLVGRRVSAGDAEVTTLLKYRDSSESAASLTQWSIQLT